jgi:hypothetical protein
LNEYAICAVFLSLVLMWLKYCLFLSNVTSVGGGRPSVI